MNEDIKRVLCIVASMNTGGAETFLMKIYRNLDTTKYQMDFVVAIDEKGFYDDEIIERNGRIFHITPKSKNPLKYVSGLYKIIKNEEYNYVMRINEHSLATIDLIIAKMAGAQNLIMRTSNAGSSGGIVKQMLHKMFICLPKIIPTVKIAPSTEAAEYTFGKNSLIKGKVFLLHNAIPTEKYIFNRKIRKYLRDELGVAENFVMGHIGRFVLQKNHDFLINIFAEVKKEKSNAILLLIGEGELEDNIREKVKKLNLIDSVKFLGVREDIPNLLMAMDIFILPSYYEGMPNTVIEAQATGLRCIISDTITREANITGLVDYESLHIGSYGWSKQILKLDTYQRINMQSTFKNKHYDIESVVSDFNKYIFEI